VGASVQSTTGSRGVRISGSNAGYTMFGGSVKGTGYPLHLNQWGRKFSRLLAAEVCASAVVMLDTPCSEFVRRVLATHCIRQFSLHFPSVRHRVPSASERAIITKPTDDEISPSLRNHINLINTNTFSDESLMMAGIGRNM